MKLKSAKNIQLTKRFVLPITTKEKIIDLVMQGFLEILGMVLISKLLSWMYVADLVRFQNYFFFWVLLYQNPKKGL